MARTIPTLYQQVAKLFLAAIPAPQTPEMIAAVSAWELQELGNVPQITANNPWNLHGVKGDYGGLAIGDWYAGPGDVHVAVFGSLADGVAASVMNLRAHGSDFAHYDRVLAAAKSGDPIAFLDALAASAWSAGRYGTKNGGPNTLVAIYRTLALPAPAQAPTTGGSTPVNTITQKQPAVSIAAVVSALLYVLEYAGLVKIGDEATLGPQLTVVVGVLWPLIPLVGGWITHNVVFSPATVQQIISTVASPTATTQPPATSSSSTPVVVAPRVPITARVTMLPTIVHGTTPAGTRRFAATDPYTELPVLEGVGSYLFDAEIVIEGEQTPHGTLWRTTTLPPFVVAKASVAADPIASAPLDMGTPSITAPSGQVSYLGSPDAPPPGLTVAGWLAGPSRDTYGYFMQILYIDAHPDAPVAATFPAEATRANVRPFAIAQFGIEVLGSLTNYPPLSVAIVDKVALDMLACEQSLGQQADGSGIPHTIWTDAQWRMVGGRTRAIVLSGQNKAS